MTTVPTFTATIYVGFREGRTDDPTPIIHSLAEAEVIAQAYCDEVGLCVTVTPTTFIYTRGREPGCAVGLINYPRFPSSPDVIKAHALALAERLMTALGQMKVSVVMPQETIMLDGLESTP